MEGKKLMIPLIIKKNVLLSTTALTTMFIAHGVGLPFLSEVKKGFQMKVKKFEPHKNPRE